MADSRPTVDAPDRPLPDDCLKDIPQFASSIAKFYFFHKGAPKSYVWIHRIPEKGWAIGMQESQRKEFDEFSPVSYPDLTCLPVWGKTGMNLIHLINLLSEKGYKQISEVIPHEESYVMQQ